MTNNNNFAHPQYLVTSEWLVEKLQDNNLRIYDCTAHLLPHPTETYTIGSGRSDYDKAHIPGADFLDLQEELSDRDSRYRFTFPKAEDFAAAVGKKGLGNNNTIILYSTTSPQWATRIWWMLRAFGFYNAKVLDGGLIRWKQQGYPTSTEPAQYAHTTFMANLQDGLIADKDEVQNAVNDQTVCTVNALSRAQHTASGGAVYGRPGRISNSENVPTSSLVNPDTHMFLSPREISQKFSEIGADKADRVLTYCGGGIAASATAMLLVMLGYENVGLYDNSMSEWANKPDLPMETG